MRVLGVSDNHNAGAALVIDGRLVAAVNEERIVREKNAAGFPARAIAETLRLGGLAPAEIDRVVVAGEITPSYFLRRAPEFHRRAKAGSGQFGLLFNLYIYYQVAARRLGWPYRLDRWLSRRLVETRLRELGFRCPVDMCEHHQAHAEAAFRCGPFERATIVTADAMGDGVTATVSVGRPDGRVERVFAQSGLAALNPYYSRVTAMLGFTPLQHEGKVTGLAAYGDAERLAPQFRKQLRFVAPGFSTLGCPLKHHPRLGWHRHLWAECMYDVAAGCQRALDEAMTAFVAYWVAQTGVPQVALAGGIFENVKLNQRIRETPGVAAVSVFPHMSDGGLAAGAALGLAGRPPAPLPSVYLGAAYDDETIRAELAAAGLRHERPADIAEAVADLLAASEAVPRFTGAMEYGPRALGHRSIYYRPDDPSANDWLNKRLGRSEFMPFAPAVAEEAAEQLFVGLDGARDAARFMTMCFACTPKMKRLAPGCVHVDGTARPQVVRRADCPDEHAILAAFERRAGAPILLNTSFNMHEEPIVMSPADAIRAFRAAGFRHLAIGPFLATAEAA